MNRIPARDLNFDLSALDGAGLVWSTSSPGFSLFINAYSVHVPYFERYLVSVMQDVLPSLTDPKLREDLKGLIDQESAHARNFVKVNAALSKRYPKLEFFKKCASRYFARMESGVTLRQRVGFVAGYETFTFLAGLTVLDHYDDWLSESHPTMKALWIWHQVEEIEHGAVAFDVYRQLFGDHEWYRKWMVVKALLYIARETTKAYLHMAKVEGWWGRPRQALYAAGFGIKMFGLLLRNGLPALRKDYHPSRHPRVTSDQNPIQVAWRRFERRGGDVRSIDRENMASILVDDTGG